MFFLHGDSPISRGETKKMKIELYKWWAYFGAMMFMLVTLGLLINAAFFNILTLTYLFAGCGLAAATLIKLAEDLLYPKKSITHAKNSKV